ncbi:MAG: OB-fold domain-containing protein [Oscillospiraceae bacterium]|nr:OB-fold domain-containing protein [Oscillospiraceae bacterium]
MVGIVSYGTHIPYYRLTKAAAAKPFGKRAGAGEKAVAYCDEDSVTMAVEASMQAVANIDCSAVRAVFFASASSPYAEKISATEVAATLDLGISLRTADFTSSLRSGSEAMLTACQSVQNGGVALAAMGECRLGAPDGKFETDLGDAAAAFVFGTENLLASVDAYVCISRDAIDQWRSADDALMRDWDVRYAATQHYNPLVTKAVKELFAKEGTTAADYRWLVLYGHDEKNRSALARKLGFQPEQVAPSFYSMIGNSGNAACGIMLANVLDQAQAGERILFVSYGDGCTAMSLTVQQSAAPGTTVQQKIDHKNNELPYGKYLKWKGLITCEPQKRPAQERSALPDYHRNYKKNHALYGSRCTACGTPVFPPQRVCVHCHAIDQMEPYRFLGKKATIRTFTMDGVSLSLDAPNILVVVEFEGGGKMMSYLVDCRKEDVKVGMAVRPTFRKLFQENGVHTYFWKVVPEEQEESK